MKIAHEIRVDAPAETVWRTLMDFPAYHEWNSLLPSVAGAAGPEAVLQVTVSPLGLNRRSVEAKITGYVSPRYFSFETIHRFGAWFYREELIFRTKEREGGVFFFAEAYVTGLSLRFRRSTVERAFRRSLLRVAEGLKERAEGRPSA